MTLEAIALHYLDNLDAKIHTFSREIRDDPSRESSWTPFQQSLGRRLFKGSAGADAPGDDEGDPPAAIEGRVTPPAVRRTKRAGHPAMADFAEDVLKLVAEPDYKPITLKAMARRFEVDPDDYAEFRATVKRLVKEGKLDLAQGQDAAPARSGRARDRAFPPLRQGLRVCPPARNSPRRSDQIYIPAEATRDASSGDEVAVKITKRPRGHGLNVEGRIVEILARASGVFVGTYFEAGDTGFVQIDGTTFREPISVGDPGAKGAKPGDKVAVEIVRYPTPYLEGEGVITEILGQRGQPGVDTLTVIRAFNIPDTFDEEVLDEAREQAKLFNETEIADALDLRGLPTVTIDPATARDFDDAISLTRDERGHWTLAVHIADVAHFVAAGSALDRAAQHRGHQRLSARSRHPHAARGPLQQPGEPPGRRTRVIPSSALLDFNPEGILTGHAIRSLGDPRRPSLHLRRGASRS